MKELTTSPYFFSIDLNMFARFDEIPAMVSQDIKETKRYRRTDQRMDNAKTVYPHKHSLQSYNYHYFY